MNQQKQNGNIIAIITMFFLFAMISFVTNLAAPFGTIWKNNGLVFLQEWAQNWEFRCLNFAYFLFILPMQLQEFFF